MLFCETAVKWLYEGSCDNPLSKKLVDDIYIEGDEFMPATKLRVMVTQHRLW
jgi:hypothetical protein